MDSVVLFQPRQFTASMEGLEVAASFNPGVIDQKDRILFLVRVAERPLEHREGFTAFPRVDFKGGYTIDWIADSELVPLDARGVQIKATGMHRFKTISHLRLATSPDGISISHIAEKPLLFPREIYEEYGVEDPRITRIGELYYITYVAASRYGIATALATTKDFKVLERKGVIFPPENKNVVLFPEKQEGCFLALHRPSGLTPLGRPRLWLCQSSDAVHWGGHQPICSEQIPEKYIRFGAGPPPVRFGRDWLCLHHAVRQSPNGKGPGSYDVNAMLLDGDNPVRVIRYCADPLIQPTLEPRDVGLLSQVIFPTGLVIRRGTVFVYCGEKDSITTVYRFALPLLEKKLSRQA